MNFYEYQFRCASKITIQRKTKNHRKLQECKFLKCNKNTNLEDTNLLQEQKKIRANFKNIMNPNVAKLAQTQKKKKEKITN